MENLNTFYKMRKIVTHIDCPKEWESNNDWDSHRPLLYLVVDIPNKCMVVEFGSGEGSTKLLGEFCSSQQRTFLSFESNREWAEKTGSKFIDNPYLSLHTIGMQYVLFVDSAPGEERKYLVAKHSWNADVIVVHDTEDGANYVYGMSEILNSFKYRLDYKPEGKPQTTAVSNIFDVTKITNW
jgi:hypothetical protein